MTYYAIFVPWLSYRKIKTLGESDSDGESSALSWVKQSRKVQEEKQKAKQRVKHSEICTVANNVHVLDIFKY